ncbi:MAG: S8 family serine peptidase [Phycisphaerales bacterium]
MSNMLTKIRITLCLAMLAGSSSIALADVAVPGDESYLPKPGMLALRTGDVRIADLANLLAGDAPFNERVYVLVLRTSPTASQQQSLSNAGVKTIGYVPSLAYLVDLRGVAPATLRAMNFVTSVHHFDNAWKIDPDIARGPLTGAWQTPERQDVAANHQSAITITLTPNESAAEFSQQFLAIPGTRILETALLGNTALIHATLPNEQVAAIASIPQVLYVEPLIEVTLRSNTATRWLLTSGIDSVFSIHDAGIQGQGQVIGIVDSNPDVNHCALYDTAPFGPTHRKILAYNAPVNAFFHGTHTSTIALGNGIEGPGGPPPPGGTNTDLRGMAYMAKMVYNYYPSFGEQNVYDRFELHRTQGAFVHSNSWGNDNTRNYDSTSRAVDRFMREHEDNLLLYSVSNSSLVTNPENAKNSVGVGSGWNAPNQEQFCGGGQGPTLDGRRKPDIIVPGCQINSALANGVGQSCDLIGSTGTSMACPAAAGLATLFRQYFTEGWYPTGIATPSNSITPSGALLKAMLTNSTVDLSGITGLPSNREGWGRPLGENVLYFANRTPAETRRTVVIDTYNTSDRSVTTGQSRTFRVNVLSSSEPLRITMAYTDQPAVALVTSAPINNLDLTVNAPTSATYLGNVITNGVSNTGGAPDALNNLEQVMIPNPATGIWEITVSGTAVNLGTQGFAIVATGDIVHVTCNDIDFNNDGSLFDPQDIEAFLSVYSEGPCIPDTATCDGIDFNNDGSIFDPEDIAAFLRVFSEGPCE